MKRFLFSFLLIFFQFSYIFSEIKFEIKLDKNEYVLFEPIFCKLILENIGEENEKVYPEFQPDYGYTIYYLEDDNHNLQKSRPLNGLYVDDDPVVLRPGQKLMSLMPIYYHSMFNIENKGVFTLTAVHRGKKSNPASFKIVLPNDSLDKEMMKEQGFKQYIDPFLSKRTFIYQNIVYDMAYFNTKAKILRSQYEQLLFKRNILIKMLSRENSENDVQELVYYGIGYLDQMENDYYTQYIYYIMYKFFMRHKKTQKADTVKKKYKQQFPDGVYLHSNLKAMQKP